MVEYGNGISQGAGQVGGSGGGGGDIGAAIGQFVNDAANTISTMPPAQLLLIAVLVVAGLFVLKRAL